MSFLYILSLTNWLSNSSLSLKCAVRRCATVSEQNEWLADCLVVGMTPGFDSIKKHMEKRMEEFARQNEFNMKSTDQVQYGGLAHTTVLSLRLTASGSTSFGRT